MTIKDREDRFIEQLREEYLAKGINMTWETELTIRYGFSTGAQEMSQVAFEEGVEHQMHTALHAIGAQPRKKRSDYP